MGMDSFFHNWLLTPGSPYALLYWCLVGLGLRLETLDRDAGRPGAPAERSPRPALAQSAA